MFVNLDSTSTSPTLDVILSDLDGIREGNIRLIEHVEYSEFTTGSFIT